MLSQQFKDMCSTPSVIRALSVYATERGKEIGYENVFDYSLGNPSVPVPDAFNTDKKLTVTPLGRIPLTSPDPLHHYGHTAGSMYSDIFSLYKLLVCIRDGGTPLLSGSGTSLMKEVHASYGALSPALSYGLGLLVINDPNLSSCRIFGHQGFAYGCADGAFCEEDTGRIMIILNGSCSESRQGRLGLCNRDMLRWSLKKELPQW